MYYIVNLETRAVLTYKDGSRIIEANADLATSKAEAAQEYHHHLHVIASIAHSGIDAAPWFRE